MKNYTVSYTDSFTNNMLMTQVKAASECEALMAGIRKMLAPAPDGLTGFEECNSLDEMKRLAFDANMVIGVLENQVKPLNKYTMSFADFQVKDSSIEIVMAESEFDAFIMMASKHYSYDEIKDCKCIDEIAEVLYDGHMEIRCISE